MTAASRVTVVIPTYNAAGYLRRSLAGLTAQTYRPLEVVVVDDGSTDDTGDVALSFGTDLDVTYLRQENEGQGPARNRGLEVAGGDYICLLDVDDIYMPTKVERQVRFLEEHPNVDVAYCDVAHFSTDREGAFFARAWKPLSSDAFSDLLHYCPINPNAAMVRRAVIDDGIRFSDGDVGRHCEEWDFFLRIAKQGYSFGYVPELLVLVEIRPGANTTWEKQPTMKRVRLEMIQEAVSDLGPGERERLGVADLIDAERRKLAAACLVAGRKRECWDALRGLRAGRRRWTALGTLPLGLPTPVLRRAVRTLWKARQRNAGYRVPAPDAERFAAHIRNLERGFVGGVA